MGKGKICLLLSSSILLFARVAADRFKPNEGTETGVPQDLHDFNITQIKLRIHRGLYAVSRLIHNVTSLYGVSESVMTDDVVWLSSSRDKKLIGQLLRALVLRTKFVVSIAGMSDTGNQANMQK